MEKFEKKKAQYNVGLSLDFDARLNEAIEQLGIKRKPSQVIAEITEEFFDIWLEGEKAKRVRLQELKPALLPIAASTGDLSAAKRPSKKENGKIKRDKEWIRKDVARRESDRVKKTR